MCVERYATRAIYVKGDSNMRCYMRLKDDGAVVALPLAVMDVSQPSWNVRQTNGVDLVFHGGKLEVAMLDKLGI